MSFKQQCPSCEERVLIKDASMVGKKVDCPKCKYRFVVDKPEGAAAPEEKTKPTTKKVPAKAGAAAAAAGAKVKSKVKTKPDDDDDTGSEEEDDRPKKKKKDGGSSKLIIWLAGGGVGLILLAVAGMFLLDSGEDTTNRPIGPSGPGTTNNNNTQKQNPNITNPNPNKKGPELAEPSNHLPRDSELVVNIPVQDLLRSPLGNIIFEGSLTTQNVEHRLGLKLDHLDRLIVSGNFTERWNFMIFRTSKPIDLEPIKKALGLKPADNPIKGQEYFLTSSNWRDFLAQSTAGAFSGTPRGAEPLAVRLHDEQTLVMGDVAPMTKFLEDLGKPAPQPGGATPTPPPAAPGQPANLPPYMTLTPDMRDLLAKLEARKPVLFSAAINLESRGEQIKAVKAAAVIPEVKAALDQRFFGGSVFIDQGWLAASLASECKDRDASIQMEKLYTAMAIFMEDFFKPLKVAVAWDRRAATTPMPNPMGLPPMEAPPPPVPMGNEPPMEKPLGQAKIEGPKQDARFVQLSAGVDLAAFDILQRTYWMPHILRQRGEADLALKRPTPHDLARAGRSYSQKDKQFPRGAYPRKVPDNRFGRPWHPDERVSGLVDLLPFLGYEAVHVRVESQKSWRDAENLPTAMTLIPFFVDPEKPPATRYVRQPGLRNEVASTHFVGIAGVGLDAGEFPADAAHADKLGIWGYDRQTKLADLGTNLSTTIFMIQVPPALRGPWLAGGGATVRGVPDKDSIRPFVARNHDGKPGTYALMADGSVRFIAADISDQVLKALAVVKKPAGVELPVLPEVPAPKKTEPETPAP